MDADIKLHDDFDTLVLSMIDSNPDAIYIYFDLKNEDKIFYLQQALKKKRKNAICRFSNKINYNALRIYIISQRCFYKNIGSNFCQK